MATAHARLKRRATTENPALLARILDTPPAPRPSGFGRLPDVIVDRAESSVPFTASRFSLAAVVSVAQAERRAARTLMENDTAALEPLVKELERLRAQLTWLESSIGYHRFWQKNIDEAPAFFAAKNVLAQRARAVRDTRQRNVDSAAALQASLARDVAPFAKTPNLVWQWAANGGRVLPVQLLTDITDTVFLAQLTRSVRHVWNDAAAARARSFRIDLTVNVVRQNTLYPEGVPALGSPVVEAAHIGRFPRNALVLTTGGRSTHAMVGQYVQLGTEPIAPRVLAHEFGHLLGFSDGYLRAVEGSTRDPFGAIIVEWTGIQDDLMGAPAFGRVTADMIEQLLRAYAPRASRDQ